MLDRNESLFSVDIRMVAGCCAFVTRAGSGTVWGGWYGRPALRGSAPNHTASSFLSNPIPLCHLANTAKNARIAI